MLLCQTVLGVMSMVLHTVKYNIANVILCKHQYLTLKGLLIFDLERFINTHHISCASKETLI